MEHVKVRHPNFRRDYVCPICFLSHDAPNALFYHLYRNHPGAKVVLKALLIKYGSDKDRRHYEKAVAGVSDAEAKAWNIKKTPGVPASKAILAAAQIPSQSVRVEPDSGARVIKCTACLNRYFSETDETGNFETILILILFVALNQDRY